MTSKGTDLLKPRNIQVDDQGNNTSKIILEPLERGFGHTLGNAFRRILLSSIPGFAVTEVKIEGVEHEYGVMEGVQEDVVEILLNLKSLAVVLHSKDDATFSISKAGPCVVTAADIELDHEAEVIDPDHVIATLTKDVSFEMSMKIEKGRGYQPAPLRRGVDAPELPLGTLVLDASFSPIVRVAYNVDTARHEQYTDMDKLLFDLKMKNSAISFVFLEGELADKSLNVVQEIWISGAP